MNLIISIILMILIIILTLVILASLAFISILNIRQRILLIFISTAILGAWLGLLITVISSLPSLIITVAVYFGIFLLIIYVARSRKNKVKEHLTGLKRFSHDELQVATDNFRTLVGSGRFGSVFKGVVALADGTTQVAVKRLGRMGPGEIGFLEEVETIGSVHHFNLARLIGFCAENKHRLLVYEYMSNGSLEKWIFKRDLRKDLNWATRKKIILGVAKGLAYLHEDCRHKIIHLDVKPQNILLDESFNAKISDFGLSKLIARDQSELLIGMLGTPGYVAPDLTVTVKSDVYSFGIVLLEIVTRRKISDSSRSESIFVCLQMLEKKGGDGDDQDQLIDIVEDLDEDMENHTEKVLRTIRIGVWCLQHDHTRRPLMSAVVQALQGLTEVDPDIIYKFSHPTASASKSNHQDHLISVAPKHPFSLVRDEMHGNVTKPEFVIFMSAVPNFLNDY